MDMDEYMADEKVVIKEIHDRVIDRDINSLKRLLQNVKPGEPLCFMGISALKRSFCGKCLEITALLLHFGTTFKDDAEESDIDTDQEYVDLVNMLWYFFQKNVKSSVNELTTFSYLYMDKDKISTGRECYGCYKHRIKSKNQYLKNILHSAAVSDLYLQDVLRICVEHFEKEEIKEMLFSTREDGLNVVHRSTVYGSLETFIKNMNLINKIIGDDEWFKQLIKCPGKDSANIFHFAAMRDWYLEDLLRFCDIHLEREDISNMLLCFNEDCDSVVYLLVEKNTPEKLMSNLNLIKEMLGKQFLKQFLKSESKNCGNILTLTAMKDMQLDVYLHIYEAHLETNEIVEMLFNTKNLGLNAMHCIVISASSNILVKNLNHIRKIIGNDGSFKELLKSEGTAGLNILHLATKRNIYLEGLIRFCDSHLKREEIKEMLLSSSKEHGNVAYYLFSHNSLEMLLLNLKILKEILGDDECFRKLLKTKGRDFLNIFHFAFQKDRINWELEQLMRFCDANLEKDDIKEMVLTTEECGVNVLHIIVLFDSPKFLIKDINLIKEIIGDDKWFKNLLKSLGRASLNIFHIAAMREMHLEYLLTFCNAHLGKEEIVEMLVSSNEYSHNVMHYLVRSGSSENLMKIMIVVKEILGDVELLKRLLYTQKRDCKNLLHLVAKRGMHLDDLLRFCAQLLGKDELRNMLWDGSIIGPNIMHHLIQNETNEISLKSMCLIKEILDDEEWFSNLLMCVGRDDKNIFHLAAMKDKDLKELLFFCNANLKMDELKEMLLTRDEEDCSIIHHLLNNNSPVTLISNLNHLKNVLGDEKSFKRLLKNRRRHSKNIFHLAAKRDDLIEDLLLFCDANLEKDEIKEMLLSHDKNHKNVIHYLIMNNASKHLAKSMNLFKKILGDDGWFKDFLKSKGSNSMNIFHLAARENNNFDELLRFCDDNFEKEEIKEMLLSLDDEHNNVMHSLFHRRSSDELIRNLNVIKEVVTDDEWFQQLLRSKLRDSWNIFHLAGVTNLYIGELLHFCEAHLEIYEIKEMLFDNDKSDLNAMQHLFWKKPSQTVIRNENKIIEKFGNDTLFQQFIMEKRGIIIACLDPYSFIIVIK